MRKTKKIGLIAAIFMIVSSLIGSGLIALPNQLATIGSIILISFLIVTVGAFALSRIYTRAGDVARKSITNRVIY